MLVGSCVPTTAPIRIVRIRCTLCPYVITAMSEREALRALAVHNEWTITRPEPNGAK